MQFKKNPGITEASFSRKINCFMNLEQGGYRARPTKGLLLLTLVLGVLLFGGLNAEAQTFYYVRAGATGANNGSDWNNAYRSLPSTLVRGATYYIADGTYSGYSFNTANSGSTYIYIKKATIAAHGTDTGWQNTYGDGQAVFTGGFTFLTDYWEIDGVTRNESNWADGPSYGFKVASFATNSSWTSPAHAADYITIKYVDIGGDYGSSYNPSYGSEAIYLGGFTDTASYWLVQRCYIHNVMVIGQHAGVDNITYEYNWIGPNWSKTGIRHQIRGSNCVYRYNIFKNACQGKPDEPGATSCTAIIGWYGNAGSINENYSNSKVYGNLFWDTIGTIPYTDAVILMGDDRTSQGGGPMNCTGCAAYNNTFSGMGNKYASGDYGNCTLKFLGSKTGSEARNNMWYNVSPLCTTGCSAQTCTNNVQFTASSSGMFVNAAGGNYYLTSDGAAGTGYALSSPYNMDMSGSTRGGLGVWDIGAFEFGGNNPPPVNTPLAAPGNVRILTQ